MAGLKDYQISVYVANLGKYVEGVLQGAWITLPMPAERAQACDPSDPLNMTDTAGSGLSK